MKLQNLTVIFIIIIIPVILLVSLYISTGLKTIKYQSLYDTGLLTATHDAIYAFELNTAKNEYSDNSETKRNILKSSVKMFEKTLANTCGISAYNADEIEEYIPAIVFGMHDGFYMYAPSYNSKTGKYEHGLKNYVYYSETLDDGTVIIYSLDNYVTVSGKFNDNYIVKEGYLIELSNSAEDGTKYKGIEIKPEIIDGQENTEGIEYYKDAYKFTKWFKDNVEDKADYLRINSDNDPEDETSSFVQHKREIMKKKIESVLNSSITAYSERTWNRIYKMPKLSEEDWQKIYSNISMITFFQGKNIGLTKYNGYCVLNSTNSNEYVNPNLMYFIDDSNEYHDIRCGKCEYATKLIGYKIGDFQKIKLDKLLNEDGTPKTDENGKQLYDNNGTKTTSPYRYKHSALACYECVNGSLATNTSVYNYVEPNDGTASTDIKTSYWTSLARERYRTTKLLDIPEITGEKEINIKVVWKDNNNTEEIRPEKLKLVLEENGYEFKTVTLSSENEWKITLKNLDIYSTYRLKEDSMPSVTGYTFEIADEENTFEITYTLCTHNWNEGVCSICNKNCTHRWKDNGDFIMHQCEICKKYERHIYSNGQCTVCGHVCEHYYWYEGKCELCGKNCTHSWNNEGVCSICNKNCTHIWKDSGDFIMHQCETCKKYEEHIYSNGQCTVCGHVCEHYYWNEGVCSICNKNCSHRWKNIGDIVMHQCEICGKYEQHSNDPCTVCGHFTCSHFWVENGNNGHTCSICGKTEAHYWYYFHGYYYCGKCNASEYAGY